MSHESRGQDFLKDIAGIRNELPFDPELLRRLFEITGEQSFASMGDLAKTIQQDQGLTTRILSMANSAFYGLQAEVSSICRAVSLLGIKEIRNLVVIAAVQGLTRGRELQGVFDLQEYWRHQLEAAQAARWLSAKLGEGDPELLFTAGLLHDLGKLLAAIHRPQDWRVISERVKEERIPFARVEDEYWGLEHGLVGAMALDCWNLPRELTEPVNWHHAPDLAPDNANQASIVCLADALSHAISDPDFPLQGDPKELLHGKGLDPGEVIPELAGVFQNDELLGLVQLMC